MNSLLAQPSPPQRGKNRGGVDDGSRSTRGKNKSSRGRKTGSRLASGQPINSAEITPSSTPDLTNGDETTSEFESSDEYEASRFQRFNKMDPGNQYEQLKVKREAERKQAIADGLIDDPDKPRNLSEAIHFVGTCQDMCPEFEMHQREYQNNVEKWEIDPATGRIDKSRAVKAFHRPAAGNEQPLPSDVRPPPVLVRTLDYLFSTILGGREDIYATHAFIRDRTRSIRQDFTVQNYRGPEAIDCHERIARYHILCLHMLCDNPNFSEQQEMEQLRKVLQSLMEFYKDTKMSPSPMPLPNEAEFRAYYALVFPRDQDVSQQLQMLPGDIFFSPAMGRSLKLRSLAQRSNDKFIQYNAEAAPNSFVRFFKEVQHLATYLEACVLETWFGSVRTGALKALRQALGVKAVQVAQVPISMLVSMLGFDDMGQLIGLCDYLSLEIVDDEEGSPKSIWFKRSTPWEEPPSYLHQFSRTIVEAKRGNQSFQAVVNGTAQTQSLNIRPSALFPSQPTKRRIQPSPIRQQQPPRQISFAPTNGFTAMGTTTSAPAFVTPNKTTFPSVSAGVPINETPPSAFAAEREQITAPIPQRAEVSPILNFQMPTASSAAASTAPATNEVKEAPPPPPKIQVSSSFQFSSLPTAPSVPLQPEALKVPTSIIITAPTPSVEDTSILTKRDTRRQSLFEHQEKLLQDELKRQKYERAQKLKQEEREQKKSSEIARKLTAERQLLREKETEALEKERDATKEGEERNRVLREKRKAEREKSVQFYATEIVNSIVREHILEVNAAMLAIAFHRRHLLARVLRHIKKICARSVRRKELYLEQMAQAQMRKSLLTRALSELDNGVQVNTNKKPRRRSQRMPNVETEEYLEDVLIKATEESKTLWKPLDLSTVITPYLDTALSKAGLFQVEWNLLMLSVEDELSDETRWLRNKFGFGEREIQKRIPTHVAQASAIWSPVMQFTGQLDFVGALIFVYENSARITKSGKPDTRSLLHEVVRQTSLQSRYKFPVLIINFDTSLTNASDVARDLDLQSLSHQSHSVPAFQVLTIGTLEEANLESSLRSFARHFTGVRNDVVREMESEKKRKRRDGSMAPTETSQLPSVMTDGVLSPPKRHRNEDITPVSTNGDVNGKLPKSIESLYKSIMSAQEELEAGRNWSANALTEM